MVLFHQRLCDHLDCKKVLIFSKCTNNEGLTGEINVWSQDEMKSAMERSIGTKLQFKLHDGGAIWNLHDHATSKEEDLSCCLCLGASEAARPLGHHLCSIYHISHKDCLMLYAQHCMTQSMEFKCPIGCGERLSDDF